MMGLLFGAIIISFASIMVKLSAMPPDVVAFYRLFVGGLGMLAVLWKMGKLRQLSSQVWKWSLFSAIFFAADYFFWHRSIGFVGPGISTMLVNLQAVVLAAVSVVFLKERLTVAFVAAIGLTLVGLYLMVGISWASFSPEFKLGIVFGLCAALTYALYLLSLKFSLTKAGSDPMAMACAVALITGVFMAGLSLGQGESFVIPSLKSLVALTILALVCHSTGWFLITRSIQQVRTSLVGLVLLLQPTLSYIWDILLFDKSTSPVELTGVALALAGIYLGSLRFSKE